MVEPKTPYEQEGAEESVEQAIEAPAVPMKWYVLQTYSGYENKARLSLLERAKNEGLESAIGEVRIPSERVVEMVKGSKRESTRKLLPCYIFVKMVDPVQNQKVWHLVKNTPKVIGFVGDQMNPVPVPESQIDGIANVQAAAQKPKPKVQFEEGEHVRVVDGPFSNFSGIVEEVKPEKGKLRVLVSIFGRATPVELDFMQVEKS